METKFIAEIGWNHMGNLSIAEKMIQEASKSGADFAKFQTWAVSRLKNGSWDNDGRREIYQSAELSIQKHKELIKICKRNSITFFSSAFSVEDAKLLRDLGVDSVKIPSFEIINKPLLDYCYNNFDKVYISTGASTWNEVLDLKNIFHDLNKIIIMHCVSAYPCLPSFINLPKINDLKNEFPNVGFSDHTQGVEISKVALSYELAAIEKHFTIDHELPGRDNKFAILPLEFKNLIDFYSLYNISNTHLGLDFQESEIDSRNNYRGRFNA